MSEIVATLEREQPPHVSEVPAPAVPFTEAEIEACHAEDRHAGAAVVCIMFAIFVAALIAYACIAFWVRNEPYQTFP